MKIHFLVYAKWVNFKMYKLYLNKAVFQKKKTYPESLVRVEGREKGAMKTMIDFKKYL